MLFQVPKLTVIYLFYLSHTFLSMRCVFFLLKPKFLGEWNFRGFLCEVFWNIRFSLTNQSLTNFHIWQSYFQIRKYLWISLPQNQHKNYKIFNQGSFSKQSFILSVKTGGKKMGKFHFTLSVNMSSNRANSFLVAEKVQRALKETTKTTSPWLMGKPKGFTLK